MAFFGRQKDVLSQLFTLYLLFETHRVKLWRTNDSKFTSLELKVDDKTICVCCGHYGKEQKHAKSGCDQCRMTIGCDASRWKWVDVANDFNETAIYWFDNAFLRSSLFILSFVLPIFMVRWLANRQQRLNIKAELQIRKKAMLVDDFPSQEIIDEFLQTPIEIDAMELNWCQPKLIKFTVRKTHYSVSPKQKLWFWFFDRN